MPTRPHLPSSLRPIAAAVLALAVVAVPARATPFTISATNTAAQTLNPGETGTVTPAGNLAVSGSAVAVTVKGDNVVVNNQGTIRQTGTGRAIRDNTGVKNLTITNGSAGNANATMRTADADVVQMNVANASVVLNNYGSLISQNASRGGAQAVDFATVSGANTVNNHAGALLAASEADAVRPGANGVVDNAGTIRSTTATGSGSDGIDGQENSGILVRNAATGLVDGGRHGITAGQASAASAFAIKVVNEQGGIIRGNDGSGINIDGFNGKQVATVVNHGTIVGNGVGGDGDGIDVDGLVDIVNTGTIRSANAYAAPGTGIANSEGISLGGGTIVNAGTIEGMVAPGNKTALGRGIILAGNDITSGPAAGTREGLYGNAIITNQAGGTIRGQSDSAIVAEGAASGFTVTIDNNAGGLIVGGGTAAAIGTGADRAVIVNAGTIDGSVSGKAIRFGSADGNVLTVSGPDARILGAIDGGTGTGNKVVVDAGAGNAFAYAGAISNIDSVELKRGTLVLEGGGRIDAATALLFAGGALDLSRSGSGGRTFASLSLLDDALIDFGAGDGTLTFDGLGEIMAGKALHLLADADRTDPLLRFAGDYAGDAGFQALLHALSIGSRKITVDFDGVYTNIVAGAVPEPGSAALLAGGLLMLGALRRRRARTAKS